MTELKREIKNYSIEDLKLIISTQQDLYSEQEMEVIKSELSNRNQESEKKKKVPEEIKCPKCDMLNSFNNNYCDFCNYNLKKVKENNISSNDSMYDTDFANEEESYIFQYVFSFIIPLIGFILGAILLSKDDDSKKSSGKTCTVLAFVSIVISLLLFMRVF